MSSARAALVTTVSRGAVSLPDFVRHHMRVGFERIFVFFDDPDDELVEAVPDDDRVMVALHDDDLRASWADWPELQRVARHELAARRMLNAEVAVQLCRNDGVGWLIELAPDELIWAGDAAIDGLLSRVSAPVGQVVLPCLTAIPESDRVTDPFGEVTLFKRPRSAAGVTEDQATAIAAAGHTAVSWFGPTEHVRAAARISPGIRPTAAYTFSLGTASLHTISATEPRVLRYGDASFAAFSHRHTDWGPLVPGLYGHVTLDQRTVDVLLAPREAVARGGEAAARYYRERVMVSDPAVGASLIAAGLCERVEIRSLR